jgi:hypothetical protein
MHYKCWLTAETVALDSSSSFTYLLLMTSHTVHENIAGSFLHWYFARSSINDWKKLAISLNWEDMMKRDLMALQEVTVEESGRKLAIRTASVGTCGKFFNLYIWQC